MTVRVVTDSTADLPPDLAAEHGITVVPLNLHFGQETYLDGIDITPDQFYQRLTSGAQLPTTSQPSVGAFMEVYEGLREGAEGIVSVHISAKLSGTCNSANQAKAELSETITVEIVDTQLAVPGGWTSRPWRRRERPRRAPALRKSPPRRGARRMRPRSSSWWTR